MTARYPFDRLEGVVGKEIWRYESCIENTIGIVGGTESGSGSGSGVGRENEIGSACARESGCVEKE